MPDAENCEAAVKTATALRLVYDKIRGRLLVFILTSRRSQTAAFPILTKVIAFPAPILPAVVFPVLGLCQALSLSTINLEDCIMFLTSSPA